MHRRPGTEPTNLVLDGEDLDLESVELDGVSLHSKSEKDAKETYSLDVDGRLIVEKKYLPAEAEKKFKVKTVVYIRPKENLQLMGLYKSGSLLVTQCEAEGFRRITYFLDRPDVMSLYKVSREREELSAFSYLCAASYLEANCSLFLCLPGWSVYRVVLPLKKLSGCGMVRDRKTTLISGRIPVFWGRSDGVSLRSLYWTRRESRQTSVETTLYTTARKGNAAESGGRLLKHGSSSLSVGGSVCVLQGRFPISLHYRGKGTLFTCRRMLWRQSVSVFFASPFAFPL